MTTGLSLRTKVVDSGLTDLQLNLVDESKESESWDLPSGVFSQKNLVAIAIAGKSAHNSLTEIHNGPNTHTHTWIRLIARSVPSS